MRELDKIDRRILDLLQKDGRTTMTDLAAKVGLSTTPVTERVRRLEREDFHPQRRLSRPADETDGNLRSQTM
ncbi:MAG: AsnC family transcriptional regulator [Zoogloeaceae bacterium]|nr:AsnC family transcriptional regulator [Zoogloeaceae bacterium]